jgi:putative transposase
MNKIKFKMKDSDENIKLMQKKINKYSDNIWYPDININLNKLKTNTWFNIYESKEEKNVKFCENNYETKKLAKISYKSKKITLILNKRQKDIINNWLNTYASMYNLALKYIKENIKKNKEVLNFISLRQLLKKEKQNLIKDSTIKVHDIDGAIKLACTMYKSALSNLKKKNIKTFRIRYWKKNKEIKIMDLEKNNFSKKGLRPNILGSIKGIYNGIKYKFETINCDCKLQKIKNRYYLFVPCLIKNKNSINKNKNKQISIDPGIRTFFTCITENKIIKIEDKKNKIKNYLKRKDKIMKNKKIPEKIKKKNELMINKKISNLITELHWKTIKYLTDNNSIILLGNMSTKEIISKKGKLDKMSKRISSLIRLYQFRQRLEFKCSIKGVKYGEINEWMTSKMCSKCGNIDKDLGGNKVYNCIKCKTIMDRDVNGARNIHLKAING